MSHPVNFVEGTFQSLIPRCEHEVLLVTKDRNGRARNCSICCCNYKGSARKLATAPIVETAAVDADEAEHEQISEEATVLLEWSKNKNRGEVKNEESETNAEAEGERASDAFSREGGDEAPPTDESGTLESIFDEESGGKQ